MINHFKTLNAKHDQMEGTKLLVYLNLFLSGMNKLICIEQDKGTKCVIVVLLTINAFLRLFIHK